MDFETTSLSDPQPTELCMVAVSPDSLFKTRVEDDPRIQNKLTMCFNPQRRIDPEASRLTKISLPMLQQSPKLSRQTVKIISDFIEVI